MSNVIRRRELTRRMVAGALALAVVGTFIAYWRFGRRERHAVVPSLPANVEQQLSGYNFTRSEQGRTVFTIHSARTVSFGQGGRTVLQDVEVEIFGHTGNRHDLLRTQRCDYNTQSGDFFSSGLVRIELGSGGSQQASAAPAKNPIVVETSQLMFHQKEGLAESAAPVTFAFDRYSGTGRGMAYAVRDGWMEVKSDVVVSMVSSGGLEAPPLQLAAGRLRYEKQSEKIFLFAPVTLVRANQKVTADHGVVSLNHQHRVTSAILEGSVESTEIMPAERISLRAGRLTGLFEPAHNILQKLIAEQSAVVESQRQGRKNQLQAQRLDMFFHGERSLLQEILASGEARLRGEPAGSVEPSVNSQESLRGPASSDIQVVFADQIRFSLRPDGKVLSQARTEGPGRLELRDLNPESDRREITAGQITVFFDAQGRKERLEGKPEARIRVEPGPQGIAAGRLPRESQSDRLWVRFNQTNEAIETLVQSGHFQYREGDWMASAQRAEYTAASEKTVLTGEPTIADPSSRTTARLITINEKTGDAEAFDKVRGAHRQDSPGAPAPAVKKESEALATNVLAQRMILRHRSQFARYEGHVKVWRGKDVIESEVLNVFRGERRVSSGAPAQTSHLAPPLAGSGARDPQPATVQAERLDYLDIGRKATYRGRVVLKTQNVMLQSDRMDVLFENPESPDTFTIERTMADGNVLFLQPGRRAAGQHADYRVREGKVVMTGGPPSVYDTEKGLTTGQRLTFFVNDDRVFVDGGEKSPALSKHRVVH